MGFNDRDYYKPSGFGGFSFFPPMIKKILIINVVVFILQELTANIVFLNTLQGAGFIRHYLALNPISGIDRAFIPNLDYNFQIWQLVTYQFLHANFTHIFFNLFALWMFGMEIEHIMGSKKFLIFYLSAGVIGGLFQLLIGPFIGGAAVTLGASGAVYGVLVAFAVYFPDRYIFMLFPPIPIKAKYMIAGYMLLEFLSVDNGGGVAHLVHIGGGVMGFLFVLWDRKRNVNFDRIFSDMKRKFQEQQKNASFRKSSFKGTNVDVQDADFYEINSKREEEISQEEIDRILDKISQSGYQNLTEKEKRILFEASKRK